jgi:hypothetical protein
LPCGHKVTRRSGAGDGWRKQQVADIPSLLGGGKGWPARSAVPCTRDTALGMGRSCTHDDNGLAAAAAGVAVGCLVVATAATPLFFLFQ